MKKLILTIFFTSFLSGCFSEDFSSINGTWDDRAFGVFWGEEVASNGNLSKDDKAYLKAKGLQTFKADGNKIHRKFYIIRNKMKGNRAIKGATAHKASITYEVVTTSKNKRVVTLKAIKGCVPKLCKRMSEETLRIAKDRNGNWRPTDIGEGTPLKVKDL